jgi:hypothetical protein
MADSMTFRARCEESYCELCSARPAVLEFDIRCDQENSRQQGSCCTMCARNLLDALSRIKPTSVEPKLQASSEPSQPSSI